MKNFTKTITNKTLFKTTRWLIMALMLLVGTSSAWADKLYLTPGVWKTGNERFAAYFFGNGEKWVSMEAGPEDNMYQCEAPDGYPNVIFCRMNGSQAANNWNNKWNQTVDINNYSTKGNWATIGNSWCSGENCKQTVSSWSTYTPPCTKETPKISISADKNPICPDETATLTATITDLSADNNYSIQWYDSNGEINGKINNTYQPTATGNYYVVVTGDCVVETTSDEYQFTIKQKPTLQSTLENNNTNVEICGTGDATLSVTSGFASYSWGDGNTKIVNATGTYTVTATDDNGCTSDAVQFEVKVLNPTVTLVGNPEQTVCSGATANFKVNLAQGQSVSWKDANGTEVSTSNPFTPEIEGEAGTTYTYKVVVSEGSCSSEESTVSATIPTIDLTVGSISGDNEICSGNATTLTLSNMTNGNVVKWLKSTDNNNYSDVSNSTTSLNTGNLTTNTYYKAQVSSTVCPNHIESTEPYLVTVNPLPTISISGNTSAVLYEDVELTATGENITDVIWTANNNATITRDATDPKKAVLTYDQAGAVTVTAKAISAYECETTLTKEVTFSAEDCSNSDVTKESTKIEIWCRETGSSQAGSNLTCYAWYNDGSNHDLNSDNTNKGTKTSVTKTSNIEGQEYTYRVWEFDMQNYGNYDVYVIFKKSTTAWDWQTSDLKAGKRNNRYFFTYDGSQNEQSNRGKIYSESQSLSVTTHSISAPAVKTVSAISVEGSGVVNFVGRVIKTGCAADANIWVGYQYKKKDDVWPTTGITEGTGEKQLVSLGNNKGKVDFSKTIEGLGDGDYHFRAYVINGYGRSSDANNYDQGVYYGIDIPVTVSTKKYPIENLQIEYANDKGEVLQDQNVTYCVGDDAYIKLIYDGSRLKPEDDVINISSTLENTFTLVEGEADLYTFVVKGNETITVNAKNKENTDNPTAELTINTYAVPVIPSIDIDKTTICSNDATGAKITVSNPQVGMTYQVYKILGENPATTHGKPKEYSEGELEFNSMTEAGTYYVRAYNNEQCPNTIAQSLDEILTVIDADATSISISPETKTVNPWVPVTFTVSKEGNYDYTFSCKEIEGENDVTSNMVINRSGDTYVVKFPKPDGVSAATDLNGQVTFADKKYIVEVKLNADVQCGTFNDESEVTLKPVNEICN